MNSYIPEDQLLSDRIERLLTEIDSVDSAMSARMTNPEEWKEEHLDELMQFRMDFITLNRRLLNLKNKTG